MQCSKLMSMLSVTTCCAVVLARREAVAWASASGWTESTARAGFGELSEVALTTIEVRRVGIAILGRAAHAAIGRGGRSRSCVKL
jgi:hypothetical protein